MFNSSGSGTISIVPPPSQPLMIKGTDASPLLNLLKVAETPENWPFYKTLAELLHFIKNPGTNSNILKVIMSNAITDPTGFSQLCFKVSSEEESKQGD